MHAGAQNQDCFHEAHSGGLEAGRVLQVGGVVSVSVRPGGGRCPMRVLGWSEGSFLLLAPPPDALRRLALTVGTPVEIRYLLDGQAFGMRSRVLRLQFHPEAMVFLGFPSEVESVSLRAAPRVAVRLPAVVHWLGGEGSALGILRDLTPDGGLLEMPLPGAAAPMGRGLRLAFTLGQTGQVRVDAQIVNARRVGGLYHLGLAFRWQTSQEREPVAEFCLLH